MKKNNVRLAIVIAVLMVIFHLLVFTIPFEHNNVFWLSYGFTLDAFVIAVVALIIAFRSGSNIKSKFYGFPIARVGIVYLLVQLVLCFLFMALSEYLIMWVGVLVYAIALGIAVIGLVAMDSVRDHVQQQNIRLQADVASMRSAQSKINQMVMQCDNSQATRHLKKLSDELRYSDPVSGPALREIETELSAVIDDLQQALVEDDVAGIEMLCKKTRSILSERNRLCKLNKGN